MKIPSIASNISNNTFGAKKLFSVKLQSPKGDVDAYISLLEQSDKEELSKIIIDKPTYFYDILDMFKKTVGNEDKEKSLFAAENNKFVVIETTENKPLSERLKGFSESVIGADRLRISHLTSRGNSDLKGIGSCIIYALSKFAQKRGSDSVYAFSLYKARPFYKRLLFTTRKNNCENSMYLENENFTQLQKLLEERYKIKQIAPDSEFEKNFTLYRNRFLS